MALLNSDEAFISISMLYKRKFIERNKTNFGKTSEIGMNFYQIYDN